MFSQDELRIYDRQILHRLRDVGSKKIESAREKASLLNVTRSIINLRQDN
ncbi:MAG: hypothetical protein PVG39_19760 [Desulfobacteraceae bacterium]